MVPPAPHPRPAGAGRRRAAALARWLHIYVSMLSFGLLFFFALTGLTLNHADAFLPERVDERRQRGQVTAAWVRPGPGESVAKLEVVEHLRRVARIGGELAELRIEDALCTVVFKGPGYAAEARIDRATGGYELTETRMGLVAVLNDLHKARDTGPGWSLLVDLSAVLMVVVSLSGLVLILFVKRHLAAGLATGAVGTALALAAYLWLVR